MVAVVGVVVAAAIAFLLLASLISELYGRQGDLGSLNPTRSVRNTNQACMGLRPMCVVVEFLLSVRCGPSARRD